jgi:iron complex outermembrane recepter protein
VHTAGEIDVLIRKALMASLRRPPLRRFVLVLGCCTSIHPAFAPAATKDLFELSLEELEKLEVIVVTAEKRPEKLQDVPLAITAYSAQSLTNFGVSDTESLQLVVPGLVYNNTGSSAQAYLRGVGTRFAFAGLEPSIATYLDDRYIPRAQATLFELADIDRVEVLKGPQGTLYGRNATGGAIRVITLDVTDERSGQVTAGVGDYAQRYLSGTLNVPLGDSVGTRLSALVKQRDGYADNLVASGVSQLDDQDEWLLRGKLRWDVSSRVTARLAMQYSKRDDNQGNDIVDLSPPGLNIGIADGGISGHDVGHVATAIHAKTRAEDASADLRLDVDFDHSRLVSITTFADFEQQANTDADGTSEQIFDVYRVPQQSDTLSQEFQWLSTREGPLQWTVGTNYFAEDTDYEILANDEGAEISQGDQNARTTAAWALFGQGTYQLDEHWALTLGARYSYENKKVRVKASSRAPTTNAPTPFRDSADWDAFTPKVTLEYDFGGGLAYLSYARGFKSGGYNYAASLNGGVVLDPETVDMVELGWKTSLLADRLQLDGSLYYYDYQDLQVTRAVSVNGLVDVITENAASAEVVGLDLDANWAVTDQLTLTAGLNRLHTEYTDFDASANVFNAALSGDPTEPGMSTVLYDARGQDLLRASDWSGFVSVGYTFRAGTARLPVVVTYSYKDDYEFDFIADPSTRRLRQDGYGLLNARATYIPADARWTLSVWGNNLTDENDYFADIAANTAGIRGSHGAPLTWGVEASYRF